jgi:hypothetical protein
MNCVEQLHGLGCFVRLKPAYKVQADSRIARSQDWPLFQRILDSAFAEIALARSDQRFDFIG